MKTSKKILSLILCIGMLASMFVAVGVSAEDTGVEIFRHDFGNEKDYTYLATGGTVSEIKASSTGKLKYEYVTDDAAADKGSYLKITAQEEITSRVEPFYVQKFPINVGSRYVVTVHAKGEGSPSMRLGFFLPYVADKCRLVEKGATASVDNETTKPKIKDGWNDYILDFTVEDILSTTADSGAKYGYAPLNTNSITNQWRWSIESGANQNDVVYLDYISIKEYKGPQITVNITGDGSVSYSDVAVASGETINGLYGGETVLNLVSNDPGKSARVTVNGKKQAVINNQITLTEDAVVNVSFEAPAIVYENYFEDDKDITSARGFGEQKTAASVERITEEKTGNGVAQFTMVTDKASAEPGKIRIANLPSSITWEEGYTYTVRFKVRADKTSVSAPFQLIIGKPVLYNSTFSSYPNTSYKYTDQWGDYTFKFTVEDYLVKNADNTYSTADDSSATSAVALYVAEGAVAVNDKLYFDDVIVERTPASKITVSMNDGGTVIRNYSDTVKPAASNGSVYWGVDAAVKIFTVTPDSGKAAIIKYNGKTEVATAAKNISVTIDGDTALDVAFIDADATAEIEKTKILFVEHEGKPAVYVYSLISNFVPGEAINYGIKLWNNNDSESNAWTLEAKADSEGTSAAVQPGQAFVIKAYGDEISNDENYTAKAFVGSAEGDAVSTAE